MEEQNNTQEQNQQEFVNEPQYQEPRIKEDAPNATAVLVLGIISIAIFWCYGIIGIILGIIGLVLSNSSRRAIKAEPNRYSQSSIKNLNAGRILSIIGLSIGGLFILFFIVYIMFIGALAMSPAFLNNF